MNAANSIITVPYPGLRPFKQEEAELFFGRESQTNEMLTRLEDQPDFRFLAVIGASGSGKSSLVRAGLLPALSQGFLLGAPADWKFVTARPGNAPLRSLANAWVDSFHPQADQTDVAELERYHFALAQLRAGPLGLVRAYRGEKETQGRAVLILIDQFEELFRFRRERDSAMQSGQAEPLNESSRAETSPTTDNAPTLEQQRNEAAAFVELLLATARQTEVPMYVVITMRSDFLGDCDAFLGLPEAISRSQYLTPRMTRSQLSEAISRPLELPQFCASIEQTLVTRILNDVGTDPDQLPLMQHALLRTWRAAAARPQVEDASPVQLLSCDYDNSGGVTHALSQDADEALGELRKKERGESLVRMAEMLFRSLAHQSEVGQLVRRPVQVSEVLGVVSIAPTQQDWEDLNEVLAAFEGSGRHFLMRTSADRQSALERPNLPVELNASPSHLTDYIDISHESLLRQWDQVQRWYVREDDAARQYRRLVDAVQAGEKIIMGDALDRALDWHSTLRTPTWAMRYDKAQTPEESLLPKCLELIEASKKLRDSDAAEAEFVRKLSNLRILIAVLVLALLFLDPLKLDRQTVDNYDLPPNIQTALRDKGIMLLPKERIKDLIPVTEAENLAQELTAVLTKLEKTGSSKYGVLHIKKALETNFFELAKAVILNKSNTSELKTGPVALSGSALEKLSEKIREDLKQKGIDPLPEPIFAVKQSDLDKTLLALKEILEKKGIVVLSDEDFKPIAKSKVVKLHALPDRVYVVLPSSEQTPLINLALKSPFEEYILKRPEAVRTIDGIFRILAHLLVYLALVFVVETVYRRLAFRTNDLLERIESYHRSKVVFSVVILLFGLVLLSVGLFCFIKGVEANASMFILGVPVGVILILLVPPDALLKRSWVPRFKEAQGILLQLCGFYALAGSVYLSIFSPHDNSWKLALLLVRKPWALVIAGIALVILGKKKCALTTEETLICEPDRAPGLVNSQTRLYSDRVIGLAAFCLFGWGLPAGVMMFRNLWGIGRRWVAGISLVAPFVGIVGTCGFGILIVFHYNKALELEIAALLVMVFLGSPFATYWLWRRLSGREIRQHVAFGGALQPLWKALLVLLIAGYLGWASSLEVVSKLDDFMSGARVAARGKLDEGQALAQKGDVDGAIVAFQAAQRLDPNINLDPTKETRETDPQAVAQKFAARGKVANGQVLARKGDIDGAIVALQAAQQLDPDIDLDPATKTGETDPQAVAQRWATREKTEEKLDLGRQLAEKGEVDGAIVAFQAAQQLDPDIDLDPATETREKDPQAVAQKFAARAKVDEGQSLVRKGDIEKALQAYTEAEKLDSSLATDAEYLNRVAWYASLGGHAAKGLEASEKAVRLAAKDDPRLANFRDTRGLARALTGHTPGAIEDFEAFIGSGLIPERNAQRREWVDALRKGRQPFTPQLLEKLRSQ